MARTAPVFGPILVKLHSRSFEQPDTQRLCDPPINNGVEPPKLQSGPRLKIKTGPVLSERWNQWPDLVGCEAASLPATHPPYGALGTSERNVRFGHLAVESPRYHQS
jgi:hypothetical protein